MRLLILIAIVLAFLGEERADAQFLTYLESATASGSLGGTPFTSETIYLTASADVSDITFSSSTYTVTNLSAAVDVPGIGTGIFTDSTDMFDYQTNGIAGITGLVNGDPADILDITNPAFTTYNLSTRIGPLSSNEDLSDEDLDFSTSLGNFTITSLVSGSGTFEAVPEPSSFGMGAVLLAILLASRWKKFQVARPLGC